MSFGFFGFDLFYDPYYYDDYYYDDYYFDDGYYEEYFYEEFYYEEFYFDDPYYYDPFYYDPFYPDPAYGIDVQGSRFDDWIVGTDFADRVEANDGDDTVEGFRGDDRLAGKDGRDVLYGDRGFDTLTGGDGRDWLDGGSDPDTLGGGQGTDTLLGGPGADLLGGDGNADFLYGEGGRDTLVGGNGDDTLEGGLGDDRIEGNAGIDVAVYAAQWAFTDAVREGPDRIRIELPNGDVDRLIGVEYADFADGILEIREVSAAEAFVFRLYDAVFDRPADGGLDFWAREIGDGVEEIVVAEAFVESDEYADTYGDSPDLVTTLYRNVLDRQADAAGHAYWTDRLENGTTEAEMLLSFTESRENIAASEAELDAGLFYLS